jgi:hypothetical protein
MGSAIFEALIAALSAAGSGPADPYFSSVSVLLHMDSSWADQKGHSFTAYGGAAISSASPKFGAGCGSFTAASSSYISCATDSSLKFTGDFTTEGWLSTTTTTNDGSPFRHIFSFGTVSGSFAAIINASGQIAVGDDSSGVILTASASIADGSWHHWAYARVSGTGRLFIDGALQGSVSDTTSWNSSSTYLNIGTYTSGAGRFNGLQDDFRITNGVGRYTSSFTSPSAAFPDH